ncbi:MAG: DUF262 domain-containing HNH endonuclease family protein [Syntrophales bacterium]|jgi:uncharacterized protein with ParB-like and HNH nuclease domain|nr:DUF262 domain-containing HNH endonuclease family protein [Syntrophales bacterium]
MEEPKSLDSLFKEKIFRIPDYQRGYAWRREHLKDFWEDLLNLSDNRSHYTGVLTLKQIPDSDIEKGDKEFFLVDDHAYHVYHVVDGQQRLTTFIIFLQAFVDFIKALPENNGKPDENIYITESLSVLDLTSRYLFRIKPNGYQYRTYIFGYESDIAIQNYLQFRIFGEEGGGCVEETFYTLNLSNAKTYFTEQLQELHEQEGFEGLRDVYKKLTRRFLFNEYVIKDEFDVFVAFETMNNRGKKLSDLELLKNRLIYLTTLYSDEELDAAARKNLRETINDAWKEVYRQLGRNKVRPLNDNDFLRAHWIMFYKYSRKTGQDYIRFLLNEQFTPKKVLKKVAREVLLETPEEIQSEQGIDDSDYENGDDAEDGTITTLAQLQPTEIKNFANSLKDSAVHWFNSFYPDLATGMSVDERQWIDRLNRIGIGYFRPLVMSVLKKEKNETARICIFKKIERFIFVIFRMNSVMANYGSSEFYNAARQLYNKDDHERITPEDIIMKLEKRLSYTLNEDKTFRISDFYNSLFKKFKGGSGYYGWPALRYFLYEYETSLSEGLPKKVEWSDLLKTEKDKLSIEHIYPQTETDKWASSFVAIENEHRQLYRASLGNLLLLSMSINASLQNDRFNDKKCVKYDSTGKKIRNGYSNGSHSEIEVSSKNPSWGPGQIRDRGNNLLKFMEERWNFCFKNDEEREKLLFLNFEDASE